MLAAIRSWARRLKRDGLSLWFAWRDPSTPWYAKALCWLVVAYALSPIDLIPDFIPVLGFVDDALLLPGLIWLALRLVPEAVLTRSRSRADQWLADGGQRPRSRAGVWIVLAAWALGIVALAWRWMRG